ncbi:HAMP domain-containing histidine kinase [Chloroflexi bacterium TSY]|nr:HAMP domain-containing histidine kinase [Chloroflexi bacterium TSY]
MSNPAPAQNTTIEYIEFNEALQQVDQYFLSNLLWGLSLAGGSVVLVGFGLGIVFARTVNRPLVEMSRAARQIAQGNYEVRVSGLSGKDEIATLGRTFNQMAEGLGSLEQLRRDLVSNVSHDLRTPLTVIRGYLIGLRTGKITDQATIEQALGDMESEVDHLIHLIEELDQVAALDAGTSIIQRTDTNIQALIDAVCRRVSSLATDKGITLYAEVPDTATVVSVDREQISRALLNLLDNAIQHTDCGGTVTISVHQDQNNLSLSVQDTGYGISPDHLPHIFERFYRGDKARHRGKNNGTGKKEGSEEREKKISSTSIGSNTGLGLAISRSIIEAHDGKIKAMSEGTPGCGSTFTIRLPIDSA